MKCQTIHRFRLAAWRWRAGWRDLLGHDDVPRYRALPRLRRLALDHRVGWEAAQTPGFWRAAFVIFVVTVMSRIAVWEHDLMGWRRDLAGALPVLVVAPWVARGRRRHLRALLARSDT